MERPGQLQSLFSQKLDRAIFATYFLGAIVPMLALAGVVHVFVMPQLEADRLSAAGVVCFLIGVGALSLAAFFALRRLTRSAVERMDRDNVRLSTILTASRDLSSAGHMHAVADTSARCTVTLTDAVASLVLLQPASDKVITVCESVGDEAQGLYERHQDAISELLENAFELDKTVLLDGRGQRGATPTPSVMVAPLKLSKGGRGALVALQTDPKRSFTQGQVDAVATLSGFSSVAFQSTDLQDSQRNFFAHVTEILVAALDAQLDRGDPRAGHGDRIAAVANSLGRELGLDEERLQKLHFAALLHDIGYLKIDRALHRDASRCRNHPMLGHRMLSRIRLWEDVAPIVLYHHEWFDGSGYPESRTGDDIPLEARIIAIADAFDKLTRGDGQRAPMPVPDAMMRIDTGAGRQFDPEVVALLHAIVDRGDLVA